MKKNDDGFVFGRIELMLIQNCLEVYFVMEKCQSVPLVELGLHALVLQTEQTQMVCIKAEDLLDYYPLPAYRFHSVRVLSLHHAVYG